MIRGWWSVLPGMIACSAGEGGDNHRPARSRSWPWWIARKVGAPLDHGRGCSRSLWGLLSSGSEADPLNGEGVLAIRVGVIAMKSRPDREQLRACAHRLVARARAKAR